MAAADQIKLLIKSFGDGDESRFFSTALQIAATEARQGHTIFAQELKSIIEKARKERSLDIIQQRAIPLNTNKRELNELIEIFQPKIKLGQMVLDEDTRTSLEKVIKEQQNWQILKQHNLEPKRKLLLTGPPGTGKTMTAQAIAGELGLAVYIIRLDGLISKYLGESIAKLRLIFDTMIDHRAVYLFDEFDSIGSHRNHLQDVGEIKRVLNSFLINIEKDNSNSIIVAATNLPESLDIALFRRFDDIIKYPLPDQEHRIAIIKKCVNNFKFDNKVNYKSLAQIAEGLNYSEISKSCQDSIKEMILTSSEKLKLNDLKANLLKRVISDGK